MKLPDGFTKIFQKKSERDEVYLSLVLEESAVQVALWSILSANKPHISEAISERVTDNAWDKRLEACDRAIARLVEKEGRDDFEKVVLGLPASYLTSEDDVDHAVRPHIKTLTHELELSPIGFVPIHQAIVHQIRQEEGVPPSVILIESDSGESTLMLYRVGVMVGKVKIGNDDFVAALEKTLKEFKDIEVLPSRILLYGGDTPLLDLRKRDLLKHPWPTRANFLHYPKIDVISGVSLASAISIAGASELATEVGSSTEQPSEEVAAVADADANITEVAPETLGFRHDVDIVERPIREQENDLKNDEEEQYDVPKERMSLPSFETITHVASTIKVPRMGLLVFLVFFLLLAGGGWFLYWILPQARIVIYQVPYTLTESSGVTINPMATVVDAATKIVPGRKQERTVTGDKTIDVIGKKDIGDPARGTVTVYNKSLSTRIFKKGIIITTDSLRFTLDSDITVASKSVSLARGGETYGQASVSVTALALGPNSNIPAGKEFSFKDFSSDIATAWNEKALSGGTSKAVTVVSRADYDSLVEALIKDLIVKAKTDLAGSVDGSQRLIDETVTTAVSQKKFDQELDQESDKLHGSVTVSITGISYNAAEVASLFTSLVSGKIPSGYLLDRDSGAVSVSNVQVKKDGSVFVSAHYQGAAKAQFDLVAMKKAIAGKSTGTAEQYFRGVSGVGGIEIDIMRSPWKTTFPVNANNISFSVKSLE